MSPGGIELRRLGSLPAAGTRVLQQYRCLVLARCRNASLPAPSGSWRRRAVSDSGSKAVQPTEQRCDLVPIGERPARRPQATVLGCLNFPADLSVAHGIRCVWGRHIVLDPKSRQVAES